MSYTAIAINKEVIRKKMNTEGIPISIKYAKEKETAVTSSTNGY